MRVFIFYHSADLDGHLSGALVEYWLQQREHVKQADILMKPINYGEPFPYEEIQPQDMVFMVDFSLQPIIEMVNLAELCHLHWIDHHKTSIPDPKSRDSEIYNGIKGIRSADRAACELVWRYFWHEPGVPENVYQMPSFVSWIGRYDRWDQSHQVEWADKIIPFQYGMRAQETNPATVAGHDLWRAVLQMAEMETESPYNSWIRTTLMQGEAVQSYAARENEKFMKAHSFTSEWGGIYWLVVNGGEINSARESSVYNPKVHQGILSYVNVQGHFWRISMRTEKNDLDLSELARAFGGGGHRKAAGFQTRDLPAELVGPDYGEEADD